LYSYALGNPERFVDPSGLFGWDTVSRWLWKKAVDYAEKKLKQGPLKKIIEKLDPEAEPGCGTLDGCDRDHDGIYDWNDGDKDGDGVGDWQDPNDLDPTDPAPPPTPHEELPPPASPVDGSSRKPPPC